jgi:signal transduction histidine kinase
MSANPLERMERNIARCRVVLSVAAILVVYIDPETPLLARWISFTSGPFTMDPRLLVVMLAHLAYSLAVYMGFSHGETSSVRTMWIDVSFGVVIATMTEGVTSPAYPFFAFAIVASGMRGGSRQAHLVTVVTLGLYVCLLAISSRRGGDVYVMRPVYLAITGYLVGYFGQQRLALQGQMRQLEATEQRHRIARDLHDGYAQALGGINLRLEVARRLLREETIGDVMTDLTELQESVQREYDDFRGYVRSLAGVEPAPAPAEEEGATRLRISAEMSASLDLADHVFSIAREGIRNVRRHARARNAKVEIRASKSEVLIDIEDDGVGFDSDVTPWSIASRVKEIGGEISIGTDRRLGAHLSITLPRA